MQKIILSFSLLLIVSLPTRVAGAVRSWTDDAGRTVTAEFAGMEGDSVLLRMSPEKTVPFPLSRLSAVDQAFVKEAMASIGAGGGGAGAASPSVPVAINDASRVPIEKRTWPENITVPPRSIEITTVSESVAQRKYVYQSEAFEFSAQAKLAGSVMKEVARTFEATRALINALPWGIVCRPPEGMARFQAALYESRQDYFDAGGPENSGGVYNTGEKIFKIPFPSLGLEKRGQTYFKNDNYSNGTLVHEITHQLMDDYLGFMPTWIIEGTAEYAEMLPYKSGTFRADGHKNAIKEDMAIWEKREGFPPSIDSLKKHMTMPREQWVAECSTPGRMSEMYHRSQLLVYYFCHLDGDGKGTRFMRFMDAVYGEVQAKRAFFADPRVKMLGGGRFSYPRSLTPPDMSETAGFKHLPILLDERSYEKIAAEIIAAYKNIGVKVQVAP